MAKKRKSFFDTDTSKEEIEQTAKAVQKEAIEKIPAKEQDTKEEADTGKLMHLYVDKDHHAQAKINAVRRGKKLGEYIQWLIDQDSNTL